MISMRPHPSLPDDASFPEIIAAKSESDASDWRFRRLILQQRRDQFACEVVSNYDDLYEHEGRKIADY